MNEEIPYGNYCYKIIDMQTSIKNGFDLTVFYCKHYEENEHGIRNYCTLKKCDIIEGKKKCAINNLVKG